MRVKAEEFAKGQYYHVYNHAVAGQLLFKDDSDFMKCISLVKQFYDTGEYSILAYCLMPNHYHFLLYQKSDIPLYKHFERVWSYYSRYFNNKYKRRGTIFEGKLQHIGIRKLEYLLHLCGYIHLNPVKAKMVDNPDDWQWSNYQEWIGKRHSSLIDREQINCFFKSPTEYEECLHSLIPDKLDRILFFDI